MKIHRRHALSLLALSTAAPFAVTGERAAAYSGDVSFDHGVASGDPLQDRVVLWTRVTPKDSAAGVIPVSWEVAEDADFRRMAANGTFTTHADRDFTVKVDASGLSPSREYFYRFRCGGAVSPVGRTRTLPDGSVDRLVLAFVTCSLYPGGYFNAYDHISKLDRVDAVVELGDYYYEYGAADTDFGMEIGRKLNRIPEPPHDTVTLADYRMRHALYKRDPDLQAAHARAPWICVWDDHETANDSWVGGAENHHPKTEGPWLLREEAAIRAYYEWMPIREPEPGRAFEAINRSFQFGDLATLIMVESRLVARSQQLEYDPPTIPLAVYTSSDPATRRQVTDPAIIARVMKAARSGGKPPAPYAIGPDVKALEAIINDPERQMLGTRQEEWLALEIAKSVSAGTPWQIFGNQVVMARVRAPDLYKAAGPEKFRQFLASLPPGPVRDRIEQTAMLFTFPVPFDLDGWDGYPAARERMYDAIKASNANAVIVSGDSHAFWVNQLYDAAGTTRVAAEFGTSSITSPSPGDYVPGIDLGRIIMSENREVMFNDQRRKGYTLLTITRDGVVGELVAVDQLAKPYAATTLARYRVSPAQGPGIGDIVKS